MHSTSQRQRPNNSLGNLLQPRIHLRKRDSWPVFFHVILPSKRHWLLTETGLPARPSLTLARCRHAVSEDMLLAAFLRSLSVSAMNRSANVAKGRALMSSLPHGGAGLDLQWPQLMRCPARISLRTAPKVSNINFTTQTERPGDVSWYPASGLTAHGCRQLLRRQLHPMSQRRASRSFRRVPSRHGCPRREGDRDTWVCS